MAYVDITEVQRRTHMENATVQDLDAMQRDIDAAAREIDWDVGWTTDYPAPSVGTPGYAILSGVNLNRAEELWHAHSRPFGATTPTADVGPIFSPQDTWTRHHIALEPLRQRWAVA